MLHNNNKTTTRNGKGLFYSVSFNLSNNQFAETFLVTTFKKYYIFFSYLFPEDMAKIHNRINSLENQVSGCVENLEVFSIQLTVMQDFLQKQFGEL